jgi:SAM-dependent methyltransferase
VVEAELDRFLAALAARAQTRESRLLPPIPPAMVPPGTTALARRERGPNSTSADRRAMLTSAASAALTADADVTGEHVLGVPGDGAAVARVVYAPDLLATGACDQTAVAPVSDALTAVGTGMQMYDRQFFETLFAQASDPWKYTSDYEQVKYDQTLSLFPPKPIEDALELACAEGHFTIQMAPRVRKLVAADVSQIALDRTAALCRERALLNVSFTQLNLIDDALPGLFDLIVCSEVLYYMGSQPVLRGIARRMAAALKPGGRIIMAHGNAVTDERGGSGFDWGLPFGSRVIGEAFARTATLRLAHEIRTPLYRVHAFERVGAVASLVDRVVPRRVREALGAPLPTFERVPHAASLPPEVAAHARWGGQRPA